MSKALICTDPQVIADFRVAEQEYERWHAAMLVAVSELGADIENLRAFFSFDGWVSVSVPRIEPAPDGWVWLKTKRRMAPVRGAAGDAARAWLETVGTGQLAIRALIGHGRPRHSRTPPRGGVGYTGRVSVHVFDDVVVASSGSCEMFGEAFGEKWMEIPMSTFHLIVEEHELVGASTDA